MEGFLPLIEGFLAFALTMLALTTAVSTLVGIVHRLRRRRAQGLRDMVRVLYTRQLRDRELLPDSYFEELQTTQDETAGKKKKKQTSGWTPGFELSREPAIEKRLKGRADFIHDMTLMPLPAVVEGLDVDENYWKEKLESAERLAGLPWYKKALHPVRWIRRWRTLRYGLEALTDEEFKQRLATSSAGEKIQAEGTWSKLGLKSWEELEAHLLQIFKTIGAASSETFARHSRVLSVVVGLFLAFWVNVDSIDLLNSYLTDPQLRADVLAQSEDILAKKQVDRGDNEEEDSPALEKTRKQLDEKAEQLERDAEGLLEELERELTSAIGERGARNVIAEIEGHVKTVAQGASELHAGLGELDEDLVEVRSQVRGTLRALTASFPIGWTRFPNCSATSPDLRCADQDFASTALKLVENANGEATAPRFQVWRATLGVAREEAQADFSQWLAGVLLTALFLGLGTPFWIQVVNSALKLRRWATDKKVDEQDQ